MACCSGLDVDGEVDDLGNGIILGQACFDSGGSRACGETDTDIELPFTLCQPEEERLDSLKLDLLFISYTFFQLELTKTILPN